MYIYIYIYIYISLCLWQVVAWHAISLGTATNVAGEFERAVLSQSLLVSLCIFGCLCDLRVLSSVFYTHLTLAAEEIG